MQEAKRWRPAKARKQDVRKSRNVLRQSYLDHLEANSGNISDGVSLSTESGHKNLVVLFDVVQATVTRHESSDLLSVLDQLDTDALANGGVRLFGLDTDLFQDDSLCVRRACKSSICVSYHHVY